ncbi:MAG: pantetheine-phosphate adenylyltransferase [Bacteroidota bacterium]|nr:pantetheine-phosphate adenylyltransferase [Bacteroidota bacterium]
MERIAVFPGSFDPITRGHQNIIERASQLFDKLYIAIGNNTSKQYLLNFDTRKEIIQTIFKGRVGIEVIGYHELTVSLCQRLGAKYLARGLRSGTDFDYERSIAMTNNKLASDIETVFFISHNDYAGLTSSIVREVFKFGGDVSALVPDEVLEHLNQLPKQNWV